jgi:hypothetical protein
MAAAGDDASKAEHRRLFSEKMMNKLSDMRDQTERSQFLSEEKFGEITECVEKWPTLTPQERKESQWTQGYAWAKKYSVIIVGESNVLVFNEKEAGKATDDGAQLPPLQPALDQATQVTHQGKVFEDLLAVHVSGGHCKAKAFRDGVKKNFGKSVPQWVKEILLETCPTCVRRLPRKPSSAGHKPILTVGLGSRGQVDLIDFQSCPDTKTMASSCTIT